MPHSSPPGPTSSRFDAAVVGLGLIGSAGLRHLAGSGLRVLGVGSPEPPDLATHDGLFSSHDDSGRITRHLDATFEWAVLAHRAIAAYPSIEERSGIAFHSPTGSVYAVRPGSKADAVAANLARLGSPAAEVGHAGTDSRLRVDAGLRIFSDAPPAGHVDPRRMRAAQLRCAKLAGAEVVEGVVSSIDAIPGGWRISSRAGEWTAERVLVAAGPHVEELVGLPVRPEVVVRAEPVVQAVLGADEQRRLAGLPSVVTVYGRAAHDDCYMVPPTGYPDGTVRIKLGASMPVDDLLPDAASRQAWMRGDGHLIELDRQRAMLEALVPGLVADRWETKPCMITDTPTHLPYLDHIGPGLVLAAGCNGYAAKSSDAIGALVAGLVREGRWIDGELAAGRFSVRTAP